MISVAKIIINITNNIATVVVVLAIISNRLY